ETIRRLCEFCNIDAAPVVANMTDGRSVDRRHLFEPPRQLDYSTVTFSKDRALASLQTSHRDRWLEMFGGRLGRRWGYPRDADR
ncbi:MAG: hypothetical protein R2710_28000, partial [Acidimicrobiales bacterium]